MALLTWLGLLFALFALLFIAQRNLYLAMFAGALVLGLFTLPLREIGLALLRVFLDPEIVLLAAAVAIIPLIGGGLEESGQMEGLVNNLRIGQRAFLAVSPALLGMLPMPGGALLSAPLVERGGEGIGGGLKAAVNVWFRHILFLAYPLGPALIASAKIAGLEVYETIPYLLPFFLLSLLLGYYFLLQRARGRMVWEGELSWRKLLVPLGIILAAPAIDLLLKAAAPLPVGELGTLAGVAVSLILVALIGRLGLRRLGRIGRQMRVWRFALIILGMFFFLNVFQGSGAPELLAGLELPPAVLCVVVGTLLGLITGRIQAPVAIVVPIFIAGAVTVTPMLFALIFHSIFIGYVLSPIHPCVSVSLEYFKVPMKDFLRMIAPPALLALLVTAALAVFLF